MPFIPDSNKGFPTQEPPSVTQAFQSKLTGFVPDAKQPSQSPFNPKTRNTQFVQPTKAGAKQMDYSKAPGTNPFSHIFSGTRDALGDIFVKPEQKLLADAGTRTAQAGVQTSNEFKNPGYDTAVDTGNPTRKNAGGTATPLASPTQPINTKTSAIETNIQKSQKQLGVDVAPLGKGKEAAKQIGGQALNAVDAIGNVSLAGELVDPALKGLKKTGNAIADMTQNVRDVASSASDRKAVSTIADNISPKMTPKETKLALKEGRLIEGQDPTLLRSGTPDTVIPSDKVTQAAQTIKEQIPNADKMSQPQLFQALNKNGMALRDSLIPVMKKTPVTDETLNTLNESWQAVKAKQLADPYTPGNVNVEKLQANFEQNYLQKSGNQTMQDLWETTQRYDASVPQSVKSANSMSSDVLQAQKAIWLQNRSVLADATHSVATGLDETSAKAFSSMTDMYTAKENILSKIKVDKTGGVSKVFKWIENNPWKSAGIGYVADKTAKALGLPSIPLP